MKRQLNLKEILSYGLLFLAFVMVMVILVTIKEDVTPSEYYHDYQEEYIDPDVIHIGVLIEFTEQDTQDVWDETASYLTSNILGHSFEIIPVTYEEVELGLYDDTLDFVIVNPSVYVELEVRYGVNRIATLKRDILGYDLSSYAGVVFSLEDSGISKYEHLDGKSMGAVSISSFGGYLMTLKELEERGLEASSITFYDEQYDVVNKVLDGTVDFGTVRTGVLEEMDEAGMINLDDFNIVVFHNSDFPLIHSTRVYPEWPVAKASHISPDLGERVAQALMDINSTDQAAMDAGITGWTIPLNYEDVHTTLKTLSVEPYEHYGEVSFHNAIYFNRVFLMIISAALFIIILITLYLLYARKSMELLAQQSQDMQRIANEANAAKGEFLANMSHEIRTPMSAIIGLAELLETTKINQRQKNYIHRLKSSSVNLLGIIENILDYSKIDAKAMKIESIEFDFNDILFNLSNVVAVQAMEKEIEFLFDIDRSIGKKYKGDPLRLGQILVNLSSNAIKFTEVGQVVLKVEEINNKLKFSVIDSGIGMTKDQINKILNPFEQADSSFTRKYGGTGLGLSITHQLVNLMGGELEISSKIGRGSTFSFIVPLEKVEDRENSGVLPKELENLKVMVIDDNQESLHIIHQMCDSFGFESKTFLLPNEAYEVLEKKEYAPDVVITDYAMPQMDGLELSEKLMKLKSFKSKKIIIMDSVAGQVDIFEKALQIGVKDFMEKPVNPSTFFNVILGIFKEKAEDPKRRKMDGDKVNLVKPGTSIILAEDNKINQMIVNELLEKEGFAVTIANDGEEVIKILEEDEFDYQLILMDIQMPNLNGRDATRIIRNSNSRYKDIPIIAMTAHALEIERKKSLAVGMNDFITKPLKIDKLFNAISKYIDIVTVSVQPENKGVISLDFLDTEAALKNLNNDEGFYLEILYQFLTDYRGYEDSLEHLFGIDEKDDIVLETHTIKGLALTIGANELHKSAERIERELRYGSYDYTLFQEFLTDLRTLTGKLENYFTANPFKKK